MNTPRLFPAHSNEYDVIANAQVIGRILHDHRNPWFWSVSLPFRGDRRHPWHGFGYARNGNGGLCQKLAREQGATGRSKKSQ
jgi:hypothetical protein